MTHAKVLGSTTSKWDPSMVAGFGYYRTGATALGTSFGAASLTTKSDEVMLIDEVEMTALTPDSSANTTITLQVNGIDLPFHFPGLINERRNDTIVWKTNGNLVIRPSSYATAKCSAASTGYVNMKFRRMQLSKAISQGEIGEGMSNVCSTNTVTGGGTSAATAKQILAGVAGYSVQVLGIVCTGHSYNAAVDNIRLGFWDGTTGSTFATGGKTIFRAYASGASRSYSPRVLIGDTKGCIQGPVGYGLYIQASTNLAGATPPADFNVIYRLVKGASHTDKYALNATYNGGAVTSIVMTSAIDTTTPNSGTINVTRADGTVTAIAYSAYSSATFTIASTDFSTNNATAGSLAYITVDHPKVAAGNGLAGATPRSGPGWWVTTEAAVSGAGTSVPFFGTMPSRAIRLRGHGGSVVCDTVAAVQTVVAIGYGADYTLPLTPYVALNDDGATAECSRTWARDDIYNVVGSDNAPGFIGIDFETKVLNRFQLAWGTMDSTYPGASDYVVTFA